MYNLTPQETQARVETDVAAIRTIMGPDRDAQFVGLLVTCFVRGLEFGLGTYVNPLSYVKNVQRAGDYGATLGARIAS